MKLQLNLLEREEDRLEVGLGLDPQAQRTSIPDRNYGNWDEDGYKDSNYNSIKGMGSNEMKRKWNFLFLALVHSLKEYFRKDSNWVGYFKDRQERLRN